MYQIRLHAICYKLNVDLIIYVFAFMQSEHSYVYTIYAQESIETFVNL